MHGIFKKIISLPRNLNNQGINNFKQKRRPAIEKTSTF